MPVQGLDKGCITHEPGGISPSYLVGPRKKYNGRVTTRDTGDHLAVWKYIYYTSISVTDGRTDTTLTANHSLHYKESHSGYFPLG